MQTSMEHLYASQSFLNITFDGKFLKDFLERLKSLDF